MLDFLFHLWAGPPRALPVDCPIQPGQPSEVGFFAPDPIVAAFTATAVASAATIVLLVFLCYVARPTSLGSHFVRRWWMTLAVAGILGFLIPLGILSAWPTTALAGSCPSYPVPFEVALPWSTILGRATAGAVWSVLAFASVSLVLTRTLGYSPHAGGFFHNRGCPYPRLIG